MSDPLLQNREHVIPSDEAADLLNVSHSYPLRLLEEKKLPFHKVGTSTKVLRQDIMAYKEKTDAASRKILDELVEEAQKFNLGY
jgi:excisionase family DNA binding protein